MGKRGRPISKRHYELVEILLNSDSTVAAARTAGVSRQWMHELAVKWGVRFATRKSGQCYIHYKVCSICGAQFVWAWIKDRRSLSKERCNKCMPARRTRESAVNRIVAVRRDCRSLAEKYGIKLTTLAQIAGIYGAYHRYKELVNEEEQNEKG